MKRRAADLKITRVKHICDFTLLITFSDGKTNEVDFEPFLKSSLHPEVKKYLDQKKFSNFSLKNGDLMWGDFDLIFPITDLYQKAAV